MTPREFVLWLDGYLANTGMPSTIQTLKAPILEKLKTVDMGSLSLFPSFTINSRDLGDGTPREGAR